jgi:hypothetical protein
MNKTIAFVLSSILSVGITSNVAYADTTTQSQTPRTALASFNWAGYVADAGNYTSVGGTWVVPNPTAAQATSLSGDATWVGIGGHAAAKDLIQAGTQAVFVDGVLSYQAWYEILPNDETITNLPISGGDVVSASVREKAPNAWHITIKNHTKHAVFEKDLPYVSTHATAEWIEERPIAISDTATAEEYLPLDQFGSLTFTSAYTVSNGTQITLAASQAKPIAMLNESEDQLATPSLIGNDDSSFTVRQSTASNEINERVPLLETHTVSEPAARFQRFPVVEELLPGGFSIEILTDQ